MTTREHCYDLMAANFVMCIIAAICIAAIGNRIGLEFLTSGWAGWEGGVAVATFTIFFSGASGLVCTSRVRVLSWVFTGVSAFLLFVTVIATATSFHGI